jgi:hypothetical protein
MTRNLVTAVLIAVFCLTASAAVVEIPDNDLEGAIRDALGMPTGELHDTDLATLTELHASGRGIIKLDGLQHCVNLTALYLDYNNISDISVLADLVNIETLVINDNEITDISALLANAGLGGGDHINLNHNPLGEGAVCENIPILTSKDILVSHNSVCLGDLMEMIYLSEIGGICQAVAVAGDIVCIGEGATLLVLDVTRSSWANSFYRTL